MAGEWSVGCGPAHSCNPGGGPTAEEAKALWLAQKWGYLSAHVAYAGKAAAGGSSFAGDFFWTARMGLDWDPDPAVCAGPTSTAGYEKLGVWDWSMIRLIALGLATPLSKLADGGLTPAALAGLEATACAGSFPVNC